MKNKPKTLEEFLKDRGALITNFSAKSYAESLYRQAWNAATEATRAEYDEKIKAMQAGIDERDNLLWFIREYLKWRTRTDGTNELILSGEEYMYLKSRMRELNQRGEDDN